MVVGLYCDLCVVVVIVPNDGVLQMRKLLLLVVCFAMIAGFASAAEVTMKVGHSMPTDTSRHKALIAFKEYVEKESKGAIEVQMYPSGQLGKEAEMLESLKMGEIEGYLGGVFDAIIPMLNLYLMPFVYPDAGALMAVSNSPLGQKINDSAEVNGIKILANGDAGSRNYTNSVRPIKTPKDLEGLKMRTPPVDAIIMSMEAVGGNPVSIAYAETYMALKTGVADGQENPFMNIATMKFQEVQKYMTVVHYMFNPEPFCVGLEWFNNLKPEYQKIITDGAWVYTKVQNDIRANTSDMYLKMIKDAGVEVYVPTPKEYAMFAAKCVPVYQKYIDRGDFTKADFDEAKAIVAKYEASKK